jgi:hypothetical protein
MSDVDYNDDQEEEEVRATTQKKGGYDARVEQWLHEHPDQIILITNAGKEGVNYIQYTINCGVCIKEGLRNDECSYSSRVSRSSADTPSLLRCARRSSICTPPS